MSETARDVALEAIDLLEDALATIDFEYGHIGDEQEREHADMVAGLRRRAMPDPTCHAVEELEPDGIGAPPRYTTHCSRCGQLWDETGGVPRCPAHCPGCGARVVGCDD